MTIQYHEIDGVVKPVRFPDDPGLAGLPGVVWQARFVDEITGQPVAALVQLTSADPELRPVAAPGGLAGLVGRPTTRFPDLPGAPVVLSVVAKAEGYLPLTLSDTLVAAPDHPFGFAPAGPGTVALRSLPVALEGRVVRRGPGGAFAPVAGADVTLSGLWENQPPPGSNPAPDPALCAEVRPQVDTVAPVGTAVRRLNVNATPTGTTLRETAPAGAETLFLADRTGFGAGQLVELDATEESAREIVRILSLSPVPPSPFAGLATLSRPLKLEHLEGASALRRAAVAVGPARILARAAAPGDRTLFLDDASGLFSSGWVRIGSAADALIYRVRAYAVQSDADGYFRFPRIGRIARGFIDASDALSSVLSVPWTPARDGPGDWLDIVLPP